MEYFLWDDVESWIGETLDVPMVKASSSAPSVRVLHKRDFNDMFPDKD